MTDLILDEYESMTDNQRKELHGSIQSSSSNLHLLLEDLLKWSRAHSGNIVVNKQIIGQKELCDNLFAQLKPEAQMNDIHLVNETDPKVQIVVDPDLTGTVLRNLVSNAIKFTQRGDEIWICSEELIVDQKPFLKISVIDQGVGIKSEILETIFRIDKTISSPGTYGKRSTFLVTLPLSN